MNKSFRLKGDETFVFDCRQSNHNIWDQLNTSVGNETD